MGLIKEPLDVDFYVDSRPITKDDKKAISDYIKADKLKRAKKISVRSAVNNTHSQAVRQAI